MRIQTQSTYQATEYEYIAGQIMQPQTDDVFNMKIKSNMQGIKLPELLVGVSLLFHLKVTN